MKFEFTDRYQALGISYPKAETMCTGRCKGTGVVPIHKNDMEESFHVLTVKGQVKDNTELSRAVLHGRVEWLVR